jgi:hypothetical protein
MDNKEIKKLAYEHARNERYQITARDSFISGYKSNHAEYTQEDMLQCWKAALAHSFDYNFNEWLEKYKQSKTEKHG